MTLCKWHLRSPAALQSCPRQYYRHPRSYPIQQFSDYQLPYLRLVQQQLLAELMKQSLMHWWQREANSCIVQRLLALAFASILHSLQLTVFSGFVFSSRLKDRHLSSLLFILIVPATIE